MQLPPIMAAPHGFVLGCGRTLPTAFYGRRLVASPRRAGVAATLRLPRNFRTNR
jgi:hypothetical protein